MDSFKIVSLLTYYRPHVSGLTLYVERLLEGLAGRGHQVSVLTSRYSPDLQLEEIRNGVRIVRVPVWFRFSKGVFMPLYWKQLVPLCRDANLLQLNLPNTPFESISALLARRRSGIPVAVTYHCDVQLPPSLVNRVVNRGIFAGNRLTAAFSDQLVAYTDDYAKSSRLLRRFPEKTVVIPPPVLLPQPKSKDVDSFRRRYAPDGIRLVGFAARLAAEKGVEYLVEAMQILRRYGRLGRVRVLFAGEYENVLGEEKYRERLRPVIRSLSADWVFLGLLDPEEMATFYSACDVTVLPSINSTESFGLVQVESMLCGTPVVASDLPGVRVPVQVTGMGRLVPPRDGEALAGAIEEILKDPAPYLRPRDEIERFCSMENSLNGYELLFEELIRKKSRRPGHG